MTCEKMINIEDMCMLYDGVGVLVVMLYDVM